MKKILFFLLLMFSLGHVCGQEITRNGNVFVQTSTKTNTSNKKTEYTYKDSKGNIYDIYISSNGRCFIIKTSSKTGKEYKYYLKEEVCREICKEIGMKYVEKVKEKK